MLLAAGDAGRDPYSYFISFGAIGVILATVLYTKLLVAGWVYQAKVDDEGRARAERDRAWDTIAATRQAMDDKILPAFFASAGALEKSTDAMRAMADRAEIIDDVALTLREVQGYLRGRRDGDG